MLAAYLPIRMTTAAYTARGSEKTPTTRTMQMARTRLWCNLRGEQELDLEAESATTTMIVRCYCTQDSQRRTCCVAVSGRAKLACCDGAGVRGTPGAFSTALADEFGSATTTNAASKVTACCRGVKRCERPVPCESCSLEFIAPLCCAVTTRGRQACNRWGICAPMATKTH